MENKESIGGFEVFDSPEALSASMTAEPQQTETTTEDGEHPGSRVRSHQKMGASKMEFYFEKSF